MRRIEGPGGGRAGAGAGRRQADRLPWPALPMKPPAPRHGVAPDNPTSERRVAACLHAACRGTPPAPWFPDRPRRLHLAPARAEGRRGRAHAHAVTHRHHSHTRVQTWIAALLCTAPLINSTVNRLIPCPIRQSLLRLVAGLLIGGDSGCHVTRSCSPRLHQINPSDLRMPRMSVSPNGATDRH